MKKHFKKLFTVLLAFALLSSPVGLLKAHAQTDYERRIGTNYCGYDTHIQTIDGIDYTYIIVDDHANLIHLRFNETYVKNSVLTLPTELGGYKVTDLGCNGGYVCIFDYLDHNPDDPTSESFEYAPELFELSTVIIPEGYESIWKYSLAVVDSVPIKEFPSTLKFVQAYAFEVIIYQSDKFVYPEAYFEPVPWYVGIYRDNHQPFTSVVLPCRYPETSGTLLDVLGILTDNLYVPSSCKDMSYFEDCLYTYEEQYNAETELSSYIPIQKYADTITICCHKGSVIEEEATKWGYTVNTDIPDITNVSFEENSITMKPGDIIENSATVSPSDAIWKSCDYVSSDPEVVSVDAVNGKLTALKEGTATITATAIDGGKSGTCTVTVKSDAPVVDAAPVSAAPYYGKESRAYSLTVAGSPLKVQLVAPNGATITTNRNTANISLDSDGNEVWTMNYTLEQGNYTFRAKYSGGWETSAQGLNIEYTPITNACSSFEPLDSAPYFAAGTRDYNITVKGSPSKVQLICPDGGTVTMNREKASITQNDDGTENWQMPLRLVAGTYTVKAKYATTWESTPSSFEIAYSVPKMYSASAADSKLDFVTDSVVEKVQLVFPDGGTSTYSANRYSTLGDDGLRHWTITRSLSGASDITLRIKSGRNWLNAGKSLAE